MIVDRYCLAYFFSLLCDTIQTVEEIFLPDTISEDIIFEDAFLKNRINQYMLTCGTRAGEDGL